MLTYETFFDEPQIVDEEIREEYIADQYDVLLEKLITFGGEAYPKFGNIIIMAGGAGSGKGFIKDNLIGAEGKVFDVDQLKTLAAASPGIRKKVKDELGDDLEKLSKDLRNPETVNRLHDIIGKYLNLPDKTLRTFYTSVLAAPKERKPNIIFDVTLKDLRKLENLTRSASALGYDKKNIHIVWVVNDIEIAKKQNATRDREVPVEILVNTHRGASQTMQDILNMGQTLKNYMNGDIVFAFNKIGVDSKIDASGKGGMFISTANYFYVKRAGQDVTPVAALEKDLKAKIGSYVPKNAEWA